MRLCLRAVGCLRGLDPEYSLVAFLPFRRLSLAGLERRRISVKTIQETPFPLAGRRLAGSVEARLPSVGSVLARSDPVRGRGLGSAPGASASSARMLSRCPKGALLQRRRNSLKFGLAQWEGSGIILTCALKRTVFLGSSTAEHPAVNRRVVGSNPTRGAKFSRTTVLVVLFLLQRTSPFAGGGRCFRQKRLRAFAGCYGSLPKLRGERLWLACDLSLVGSVSIRCGRSKALGTLV